MNCKKPSFATIALFTLCIISGCITNTPIPQMQETAKAIPTNTRESTKSPQPSQTPYPISTNPAQPTQTSVPSPTTTQFVSNGIIRRLCPFLQPPLGIFSVSEPVYDNSTDPPTLHVLYQVVELNKDSPGESCTFPLSPPPMGNPQFGGESLFWMSYDHEAEWIMVWKYDPNDVLTDDVFPSHSFLRQTRTNTSIGKTGLFDFVVNENRETMVWSYTDPQPYDDNEIGYVQSMYGAATSGPIDQRPPADIWFDFVPEGDTGAKIIRLLKISADGERVYYSQEPVGLGRQWPEPLGHFTSLYSIPTWGDSYPKMYFDCGSEFWCISDFSEEYDLLVTLQDGSILIREMSTGEVIAEVRATTDYPLVRQAMIGPDGTIAFLGAAMGESDYGDPPENAAIFLISPPYTEEPVLVLSDAGLLNLLGWASPSLLLADGNNLADNGDEKSTLPTRLMLADIETGVGKWLRYEADLFVSLLANLR